MDETERRGKRTELIGDNTLSVNGGATGFNAGQQVGSSVCAHVKAVESQRGAQVWSGPENVGQRKRNIFWGGSVCADGGVTGNVTGN